MAMDSMGVNRSDSVNAVLQYLKDEHKHKNSNELAMNAYWTTRFITDGLPKQSNGKFRSL